MVDVTHYHQKFFHLLLRWYIKLQSGGKICDGRFHSGKTLHMHRHMYAYFYMYFMHGIDGHAFIIIIASQTVA